MVQPIPSDDPLYAWYNHGRLRNGKLCVVFSSIGHEDGIQPPELVGSAARVAEHALFISDVSRSWFNSRPVVDQTVRIIESVRDRCVPDQTLFTGISMGGFSALAASTLIDDIHGVLAFSPQYSPFYKFVPEEYRWRKFRRAIPDRLFRFIDVARLRAPALLLFGDIETERFHLDKFNRDLRGDPAVVNAQTVSIHGCGHNVAQYLKNRSELGLVLSALAEARTLADVVRTLPEPFSHVAGKQGLIQAIVDLRIGRTG